jgi:peptide/nickel transport system permease protein
VTAYILRRLAMMIPVAFFASVILFALLKLTPGDPVQLQLGEAYTPAAAAALRAELGLDQPLPVQYLHWLKRVLQGNFGQSIRNGAPVLPEILSRVPATLQLGLTSFALSLIVALPLGILAAVFRRSPAGFLATAFTQAGVALPNFFVGLVLIFVVSLSWRLLPPGGYVSPTEDPYEFVRRLILPAITLSLAAAAIQTRFIRSGLLETLYQDYIRTARAKGLRERAVVTGHALKNALIPSVTLLGLQIGAILEGAFITETIFAWPGVGRLGVQALGARDYPIVQGVVVMAVFAFMLANLVVDIAYAYLDPRISYGRRRG